MPAEIHKNDANTAFRYTVKDENGNVVSLVGAVTKQIIFQKPDGVKLTKTASFVTNGSDGKIEYATSSGELDVAGMWRSQCFVDLGASGSFYTDITRFKVHDNL